MKTTHIVEAALFSAGRAVSVQEVMDHTGLTKATVDKAMVELQKAYAERDTVLEIGKAGAKWGMQVKRQAAEPAAKFAQMEIAPKLLKTLALIAYHQPMKQSDLSNMIGSKVYDHIPELKERGLIKTRRDGQTKILTTTQAFPEYFGLEAASPDEVRRVLAKLVGLDPDKDRIERFDTPAEPAPRGEATPGDAAPNEILAAPE